MSMEDSAWGGRKDASLLGRRGREKGCRVRRGVRVWGVGGSR